MRLNKPFDLMVPLRTRLNFLTKFRTLQEENIQDECEHKNFEKGECAECGLKCEHWDSEDGYCLFCGEPMTFSDPREEPEYWGDR